MAMKTKESNLKNRSKPQLKKKLLLLKLTELLMELLPKATMESSLLKRRLYRVERIEKRES